MLFTHLDAVDLGLGRAFSTPCHQVVHSLWAALEPGLHPAVGPVADPAGDALGPGPAGAGVPEEHPLDPARNQDPSGAHLTHRVQNSWPETQKCTPAPAPATGRD